MKTLLMCLLFLVGLVACDGDDCPLPPDAAAAAVDAAPPDAAAAADAAPPDAVPCGGAHETCCRVGDSCQPGFGCIGGPQNTSECVPLADGAP
jgi:hypothetical protein